jgi:hypothetical protein
MKKPNLFSCLIIGCLMICQCGFLLGKKVETRTVWESGDGYIRLFHEVGSGNRYDQPFQFHQEDMNRILETIFYSKNRFFRWSSSSRVFEEDQAAMLAPFFQRAFLEAGPEDLVEFYLPLTEKRMLGLSGQTLLTRGWAFVRGGKLHVHFENVRQKIRSYSTHSEDQEPLPPSGWKLVPQKGQTYGTEGPSGKVRSENLHWLTIDLAVNPDPAPPLQAVSAPVPPTPDAAPAPEIPEVRATPMPEPKPEAHEKLQELKEMQKEGLITQKDYERKKQEILDGF